jgi:hypothetical protein
MGNGCRPPWLPLPPPPVLFPYSTSPPPVVHVLYDKVARQMNDLMISTGTSGKKATLGVLRFRKGPYMLMLVAFSIRSSCKKGGHAWCAAAPHPPWGFIFCICVEIKSFSAKGCCSNICRCSLTQVSHMSQKCVKMNQSSH